MASLATVALQVAWAQAPDEDSVKAVFLLRFAAFAEWPAAAFASQAVPFGICVSGPVGLVDRLQAAAAQERIHGRAVAVIPISSAASDARCHVIYIGEGGDRRAADLLVRFGMEPVLTVTDERNSARRGMIHFVVLNSRVRFHVDLGAAQRVGLRLSARLLNVAVSVKSSSVEDRP